MTRLTTSQALVRYLVNQYVEIDGHTAPYFGGVWAIFGHGNVAGLGEALYDARETLPTYRAHSEQGMGHAAIAYAKAHRRRRAMACTSSIGPGATNLVTAAALAHVNRLPVLLLPGDVFANRRPDPVLQQIEDFSDGTVSVNDCFRPVSRYFDRIMRPEQLVPALTRVMHTLIDPSSCGPVTLSLCQDVQSEAHDFDDTLFARRVWPWPDSVPASGAIQRAAELIRSAQKPLLVCGGGVHYADAVDALCAFVESAGIPVAETQAGKSALRWDHALNLGAIGVTGSSAANNAAREADLVIAVGTRLQDFTTASRTLFANPDCALLQLNCNAYDSHKHGATACVGDAKSSLVALAEELRGHMASAEWTSLNTVRAERWAAAVTDALSTRPSGELTYANVIGALDRISDDDTVVVSAAGSLPGELHKLWRARRPGSYHVEYGYSCMGYEIAGGLGVKMANPNSEVIVAVGDGSYLMMNSEIATAVMLGAKLTVVVFDNYGYACIDNLQQSMALAPFNNLLEDVVHSVPARYDLVRHAQGLGANARAVTNIDELDAALAEALSSDATYVIVVPVGRHGSHELGGAWWDVAVPEASQSDEVRAARASYDTKRRRQQSDG